jgi:hypothetical protein
MTREQMVHELIRNYTKQPGIRLKRGDWGEFFLASQVAPQEIRSGAIVPDPDSPGCYCVDANTASGLRRFRGAKEANKWGDVQSGVDYDYSTDITAIGSKQLKLLLESFLSFEWPKIEIEKVPEAEPSEDDIIPDVLLRKLESVTTSHEEKRRAVIESEVIGFPSESIQTLNRLLYQFIQQHRDSDNQEDIIAVGCAIRKYVAVMSQNDLSHLADLLDAQHNATVPIEVELEIAKTLVRKLSQTPPEKSDSEPQLAERLYEIVELYLNPRLLARDKFAAVALNAILSLCLLRSAYSDKVQQSMQALQVSWFSELVLRRASQIQETLQKVFSVEQVARYGEQLISLSKESALCDG